jgi:hypothetical protein
MAQWRREWLAMISRDLMAWVFFFDFIVVYELQQCNLKLVMR